MVTRGHWGHTELLSWATGAAYGDTLRVFLSASVYRTHARNPALVTPAHRKGGSESSPNCLWLLRIPLASLLFSYCSITLAFPLVLGCTESTYAVVCLLPRAQLSRVRPLQTFFPGHARDSSQFLPGPFLSWEFSSTVSYVSVYKLSPST